MIVANRIPSLFLAIATLISGREEGALRRPVYHAEIPENWHIETFEGSLRDTMKPIVTYWIDKEVRITVHNFPSEDLEKRVPPGWQVERWKKSVTKSRVHPIHQNGYWGLCFEGEHNNKQVLAWALQVDPDLYQMERLAATTKEELEHAIQKTADLTIKVEGPSLLVEAHRPIIEAFVASLEPQTPFHP